MNHVVSIVLQARLAQSAERKALNLVVVGSSPTVSVFVSHFLYLGFYLSVAWGSQSL